MAGPSGSGGTYAGGDTVFQTTVAASAVTVWIAGRVGGSAATPWRLLFNVAGVVTNGATGANFRLGLRRGGSVVKVASVALGTVAKTDRAWFGEVELMQQGAGVLVNMRLMVDAVTLPQAFAFWIANAADFEMWEVDMGFTAAVAGSSATSKAGFVNYREGVSP